LIDGSRWRITRVLREHAESIIRAENQLLSVFLNNFLRQYEANLTTLKQISGASNDEAQVKFASGMRKIVDQAAVKLMTKRDRIVSGLIDSPDEVQRLRSACEGTVGLTEVAVVGQH